MTLDDHIETVDCFPVTLPLAKPLVMATYRIDDAPLLFVRIRTKGGFEGWGEAAPNAVMSGETLAGMVSAMNAWFRPWLLDKPVLACRRAISHAFRQTYGNGGVKAAIDMSLLDLEGQILGVPAVVLLGGAARSSARVVRLVGSYTDMAKNINEVEACAAQGFSAFKLKVGMTSVHQDIETVRHLSAKLQSSALLGVDANMGWDLRTARTFAQGVAQENLAFFEQPLPAEAVAQMSELARTVNTPLCADEAIHGIADILNLRDRKAISGVGLKTNKLGGVGSVVDAAIVSDALGLSVNIAMMMESSLSSAALVHAACAVPQLNWGLVLGCLSLAVDPVTQPLVCVGGHVRLPSGAGLGVKVDVKMLNEFRVSEIGTRSTI